MRIWCTTVTGLEQPTESGQGWPMSSCNKYDIWRYVYVMYTIALLGNYAMRNT